MSMKTLPGIVILSLFALLLASTIHAEGPLVQKVVKLNVRDMGAADNTVPVSQTITIKNNDTIHFLMTRPEGIVEIEAWAEVDGKRHDIFTQDYPDKLKRGQQWSKSFAPYKIDVECTEVLKHKQYSFNVSVVLQ